MREFLAAQKLELIVLHWFRRIELTSDWNGEHPMAESSIDAWLAPDLTIREGEPRRTEHHLA